MKPFKYTGPTQNLSLATGTTIGKDEVKRSTFEDFALVTGHSVDLPEDHPVVKNMIEAGFLTVGDTPPVTGPVAEDDTPPVVKNEIPSVTKPVVKPTKSTGGKKNG